MTKLPYYTPVRDFRKMDHRTAIHRFMEYVAVQPNGCWHWMGARNGKGYGHFQFMGKQIGAHVASVKLFHYGPERPGRWVARHLCHVRQCVNPQHLATGTYTDNMQDWRQKNGYEPTSRSESRELAGVV